MPEELEVISAGRRLRH